MKKNIFIIILLFFCNIFLISWKIFAQEEITAIETPVAPMVNTQPEEKKIETNNEKDKEKPNKEVGNMWKKDFINAITQDQNDINLEKSQKKLSELENEVIQIKNNHNNISNVEAKIKEEIKKLEYAINSAGESGMLKEEINHLKNELNVKKSIVEELVKERWKLVIKEEELKNEKEQHEALKIKYEKIVKERNERRLWLIFWGVFWLILYIISSKFIKKHIRNDKNKQQVDTIVWIIDSIVYSTLIIFIVIELISIYKTYLYLLMIVLWSVIISFKDYILSFFAFFIKILFTYKVGDTFEIDKKIAKIKKMWIFFMDLELYTKELVPIGERTYFNQQILLNGSAFNINELWFENEYEFTIKKENFNLSLSESEYNLLWLIDELCKQNTASKDTSLSNLNDKLFLFYHIRLKTDKNYVYIIISTKTLRNRANDVYRFLSKVNELVLISERIGWLKEEKK